MNVEERRYLARMLITTLVMDRGIHLHDDLSSVNNEAYL